MQKRWKTTFAGILLISILAILPAQSTFAAEGETGTEDTTNARGPGAVILMVGIASLGLVGFAYASPSSD